MSKQVVSVWILGDQLLAVHPAIMAAEAKAGKEQVRIVLVESRQRTRRLPYHQKKQVLIFSAMRHYAAALCAEGYQAEVIAADSTAEGLRQHGAAHRPERMFTMAASAYGGRQWQQHHLASRISVSITIIPNRQFMLGQYNPYPDPEPERRYTQEYFYRKMRRHFDVLMEGDGPAGGEWNYDRQNREPLPVDVELPQPLTFAPDDLTQQVMAEVQAAGHGVGSVDGFNLAVTHEQAQAALDDFVENRLSLFGPYEDAMTGRSRTLFHSVLSPYINLGLLTPRQMISAAVAAYDQGHAPINSVEGFVRQVLGWREFMFW